MLTTYEVRWFYSGNIPESIESWFKHCLLSPTKLPEKREDVYLYAPNCDYLGIKLRQGALEIKWRYPKSNVMNFGSVVEGNVEKWSKWRLDSTGEAFQLTQIGDNPVWVRVAKVRFSQLYQVVANTVQPVSSDPNVDNGCSLELTNIEVNGNKWWSIALEAFGEDSNLKDNLQVTANFVFRNYDNFSLQAKSSYGYPSLLELAV
ncbi:hypothetical protein [Rivularia sp. UHCC 0363]|uniref:hypothetical protein n=1 Tax=Rivularia sp. UHCC 0363 TaxID=3110244 RepID=UPI002B1F76AC|nr:hypothetical protein [Rivularia sp. UHCC 0363]MEA5599290.1 hypothetical protein [Rivularia sp. UHCC 0363]